METPNVSNDDILDVSEMMDKLTVAIDRITSGNEKYLSLSAIMSSMINTIIQKSDTLYELQQFRDVFLCAFDDAVNHMKLKD